MGNSNRSNSQDFLNKTTHRRARLNYICFMNVFANSVAHANVFLLFKSMTLWINLLWHVVSLQTLIFCISLKDFSLIFLSIDLINYWQFCYRFQKIFKYFYKFIKQVQTSLRKKKVNSS